MRYPNGEFRWPLFILLIFGVFAVRVGAALAVTSIGTNISTDGMLTVVGNAAFDTNTLFVDSANNAIGIGTVTPGAPLEVKNNGVNAQILWLTKPQTGGGGAADQGGYLSFRGGAAGDVVRGYFGFTQAAGGTGTILTAAPNDAMALRAEGALIFGSGGDFIRMTVLSGGNVGIGETNPAYKLQVSSNSTTGTAVGIKNTDTGGRGYALLSSGSASAGGAGRLYVYDDIAGIRMAVDAAGSVGIGADATSPSATLHVNNGADQRILVAGGGSATGLSVQFTGTAGRRFDILSTGANDPLAAAKLAFRDNASGQDLLILNQAGGYVTIPSPISLQIGSGSLISKHLSAAAANLVSASIPAASCGNYGTITVTGAAVGNTVYANPDATSSTTGIEDSNLSWNAVVTAADTVTIRACNPTAGAIDAGDDQEWRADVWQH